NLFFSYRFVTKLAGIRLLWCDFYGKPGTVFRERERERERERALYRKYRKIPEIFPDKIDIFNGVWLCFVYTSLKEKFYVE
ncbi:MAG: hypothetical protein LBH60_01350, partial [Prevotellaceae bacterium]|nr:hypothetical protein [Prevotellaceae bacterium]